MENVQPLDAEREPVHYWPGNLDLLTGCGLSTIHRGQMPATTTDKADVTCPACLDVLDRANSPLAVASFTKTPDGRRVEMSDGSVVELISTPDELPAEPGPRMVVVASPSPNLPPQLAEVKADKGGTTVEVIYTDSRTWANVARKRITPVLACRRAQDGEPHPHGAHSWYGNLHAGDKSEYWWCLGVETPPASEPADWAAMSDDAMVDRLRESAKVVDSSLNKVTTAFDKVLTQVGPPPGWEATSGGFQVPADLDDDPRLWTGEPMEQPADHGDDEDCGCGLCVLRRQQEPEPVAPERRTVGLEVLTDELRRAYAVPEDSRIAVVLRLDGEPTGVIASDAPEFDGPPPIALYRLLHVAYDAARSLIDPELGGELLMPGADVLAALAGQPDLQPWTAPIPLRADQVDVGHLVIGFSKEFAEELVSGVLECEDATCPCFECCVIQVAGVEPVHFDGYTTLAVRIPAEVTR